LPVFIDRKEDDEDFLRVAYKRMTNEAKRLLLDKKYSEELRRPTDNDYEYAMKIGLMLHKFAPEPEKGIDTVEITLALFKEFDKYVDKASNTYGISDEEFEPKEAQVLRSINLLKKMALEALAEGFAKTYENPKQEGDKVNNVPFYKGSEYSDKLKADVYFDCAPRTDDRQIRDDKLKQFFNALGFDSTHLQQPGKYEITQKGGGLIRYYTLPKDVQEKLPKLEDLPRLPEYDIKETDDLIANLKGDYTSENGIYELIDIANRAVELIKNKTREDRYTTNLMHDLMPGSRTATGAELEMYKTKMSDVEYFYLQNAKSVTTIF